MLTTAINHGIIIDVEEKKRKKLNIGLMGGRIVQVSQQPLKAEREIDASGLIVSPGFIDVHGHVDGDFYAGELSACQGITTTVGGNCGYSPADIGAFFREQERQGFPVNQAMLIGHGIPLRAAAGICDPYQAANEEQIEIMEDEARKCLDEGACGISFGLDYVPGSGMAELLALAKVCKDYGCVCPAHSRLLTDGDLYSLYELILVAKETGVNLLISHFVYQYCNGLVEQALHMLEKARSQGYDIRIDSGMYTNWATYFDTTTFDYQNIQNNGWEWEQMVVATGTYKGRVMDEALYLQMRKTGSRDSVILFEGCEQEIYDCLAKPYAMPSTDIGAYEKGEGHPQIAGSFPRYFRKMVREKGILTLEEAVYKASYLPAQTFGFSKKGILAPGMDGDITIFDPERIRDHAAYPHQGLPDARPEGISYVLVNGELTVEEGFFRPVHAGKIVRRKTGGVPVWASA